MQWNATTYNRHASYVAELGSELITLLAPQAGEAILDLGCGDGILAEQIAAQGCRVIGVDSSTAMVQAAKKRGIEAHTMSGETLPFEHSFDAVFSNAALHWMTDADAVIRGVHRSLKDGGRFCAEFGGQGNVSAIVTALYTRLAERGLDGAVYNPWYFPSAEAYCAKLEQRGFTVEYCKHFERPTPLPTDVTGWLTTFAIPFLRDIPQHEQSSFLALVSQDLEPKLKDAQGTWFADYVRLRFLTRKISIAHSAM